MLGEHGGEQAVGEECDEGSDDGGAAGWRRGDLDDGDDDRRGGLPVHRRDEGEHRRRDGRRPQEVDTQHHKSNRGCCR